MNDSHSIRIKKFDGHDFSFWKGKILNGLMFLGLDGFLSVKPDATEAAEVAKDKKALAFIKDSLTDNLFRKYNQTSTKDLWDKLAVDFGKVDAQMLFVKLDKFTSCRKSYKESMIEYIDRLTKLKNELNDADTQISDKSFILAIMKGTHSEFGDFTSAMTGKKELDELIDQLIREDKLRRTTRKGNETKNEFKSNSDRHHHHHVLYTKNNNKHNNAKKKNVKKHRNCFSCGKPGHYAIECRKVKSEVRQPNQGKEFVGSCQSDTDIQRTCIVQDNNSNNGYATMNRSSDKNKWLLDSGASIHVCNESSLFEDIKPEQSNILVGDNRQVAVTGRGTVNLKVKAGEVINTIMLKNVALCPELGVNQVSIGRLESQGFKIMFDKGISSIMLHNELVGNANRSNNSFLYEFENYSNQQVLVANSVENSILWHQRLGHLSDDYMRKLDSSDFKLNANKTFCEDCHLCKATKLPHYEKPQNIINEERENGSRRGVIHSDMMGPMKTTSISQKNSMFSQENI